MRVFCNVGTVPVLLAISELALISVSVRGVSVFNRVQLELV